MFTIRAQLIMAIQTSMLFVLCLFIFLPLARESTSRTTIIIITILWVIFGFLSVGILDWSIRCNNHNLPSIRVSRFEVIFLFIISLPWSIVYYIMIGLEGRKTRIKSSGKRTKYFPFKK